MNTGDVTLVAEYSGGVHVREGDSCTFPPGLVQKIARLSKSDLASLAATARQGKDVAEKLESLNEASENGMSGSRALAAIAHSRDLKVYAVLGRVKLLVHNVLDPHMIRRELNSAHPGTTEDDFAISVACVTAQFLNAPVCPQLTFCRNEEPRETLGSKQGHGTVIGLPRGHGILPDDLGKLAETVAHMMEEHGGLTRFSLLAVSPDGEGHVRHNLYGSFSLRYEVMSALQEELASCGIAEAGTRNNATNYTFVGGGSHDGAFVLLTEGCSDSAHTEAACEGVAMIERYWAGWIASKEMPQSVGSARVRNPRTVVRDVFGADAAREVDIGRWRGPVDIAMHYVARELASEPATNEDLLLALGLRRCPLTEDLFDTVSDPDVSATWARSLATHFASTLLYEVWAYDPFGSLLSWREREGASSNRSSEWKAEGGTPVTVKLANFGSQNSPDVAAVQAVFDKTPITGGSLRLYHGAAKTSVGSIIVDAIDPDVLTRQTRTDLGQGFCATPDLRYAMKRARYDGAVVAFDVPQDALGLVTQIITYPSPWRDMVRANILGRSMKPRLTLPVVAGRISTRRREGDDFEADAEGNPATLYVFRLAGGVDWILANGLLVCAVGSV
jgi:hypothetical protein